MHRILLALAALLLVSFGGDDSKEDWATLERASAPLPHRVRAAKQIAERAKRENECGRIVVKFIEMAGAAAVPETLKTTLSDALIRCDSEETTKAIGVHLGRGLPAERVWTVRTCRGIASAELDKLVMQKALLDDDLSVRSAAIDLLVLHQYPPAMAQFEAALKIGKEPDFLGLVISGVSTLRVGTPAWSEWEPRLAQYAQSKDQAVRRAALAGLSMQLNVERIDLFLDALRDADWSTRALAVAFLEKANVKKAVGALVAQLAREEVGTRMHAEIVRALTRISGVSLGDRAEYWTEWWKNSEATFEFSKPAEKAKDRPAGPEDKPTGPKDEPTDPKDKPTGPKDKPAEKRLDSGTKAVAFYGIEVVSKRVCFVVDISGSMKEITKDAKTRGAQRLDVAKRELESFIDDLAPGCLFNIVTFSSDVESWLDQVGDLPGNPAGKSRSGGKPAATGDAHGKRDKKDEEKLKKRDELLRTKAKEYVAQQAPLGGTNIYGAFETAFADPNIDTIFFLTDGEPSEGKELDTAEIKKQVARWNAVRKLTINTIAIGTDFEYLRQIAADSGGEHRFLE